MALAPGIRLGPYEILAPLGAGGMGEVYRAKDSRLGREVAVKVLPASFSNDPDRLRRFEQEARAAGILNHPNITAVHDIGTVDGSPYVVTELLEGETLRSRLAGGPLAPRRAIDFAIQIAHGLAAAHEKGIVHRDLKPENLFVTKDGRVKILDFGLAKLTQPEKAGPQTSLPTETAGTEPGVVLGTLGYMSPEQVRGKPSDARSDIFAFGAILYEMLSGKRAFHGDSAADTMSAILREDPPDLSATNRDVHPGLDRIVRHCLEKNPEGRFHSAHDLAFDLDALSELPPASAVPLSRRRRALSRRAAGGGLLLLASALLGGLVTWLAFAPHGRTGSALVLASVAPLTHDPGISEWPTWSPDGSLLAFASNRSGNFEIYVRRVEGGQEVNVTDDPAEDFQPAFSPDGNSVAFVSTRSSRSGMIRIGSIFGFEFRTYGGDVWVAPALGGRARRLAQDGNFPAWRPDGRRLAYVSGPDSHRSILEVAAEGGTPTTLLPSEKSAWEIARVKYSPGGFWVTFETSLGDVYLLPSGGGSPRRLLAGSSHAWDGSGARLYFLNRDPSGGTRLQTVEIDEKTGRLRGEPTTLGLMTGVLGDLAVSRDGRRLAASELEGSLNLTRLPLRPDGSAPAGPEEELSGGRVIDRYPAFSPDGRRIAFASNRLGAEQLWILDLETRRSERIELPGRDLGVNYPVWSPDGRRLATVRLLENGLLSVWMVATDGSEAEQLLPPKEKTMLFGLEFSPDGKSLVHSSLVRGVTQIFLVDLASRRPRQITSSPGDKSSPVLSPDGRWIAFSSNRTSTFQLWKMPSAGGEETMLTRGYERMYHPFYSPDGKWIYVQPSHRNIYRLPAEGGPLQQITKFPESGLFLEEPTLSPDGRWLAYCRSNGGASLWLLTLGVEGRAHAAQPAK